MLRCLTQNLWGAKVRITGYIRSLISLNHQVKQRTGRLVAWSYLCSIVNWIIPLGLLFDGKAFYFGKKSYQRNPENVYYQNVGWWFRKSNDPFVSETSSYKYLGVITGEDIALNDIQRSKKQDKNFFISLINRVYMRMGCAPLSNTHIYKYIVLPKTSL